MWFLVFFSAPEMVIVQFFPYVLTESWYLILLCYADILFYPFSRISIWILNLISIQTIATVCMFLAGKVEETPRPLKDVIMVSYELIHKKDPAAGQKIKQRVMCTIEWIFCYVIAFWCTFFPLQMISPYKSLWHSNGKCLQNQNHWKDGCVYFVALFYQKSDLFSSIYHLF